MLQRTDVEGWISWFIYDNDLGKRKLKAGWRPSQYVPRLSMRPITTTRLLARLIVAEEEATVPYHGK